MPLELRRRCLVVGVVDAVARGEHLGRLPGRIGDIYIDAVARPTLVGRGRLERQLHGADAREGVEVEEAAVGRGLGDPEGSLLLLVGAAIGVGPVALDGQDGVVAAQRLCVRVCVVGAAQRLRIVVVVSLAVAVVVQVVARALDDGAVVAGEPAAHAVDDAVPPAALELGDDLDHVALAEAQARAVVGIVVVEGAHIHAAGRRPREAVHRVVQPCRGPSQPSRTFVSSGSCRRVQCRVVSCSSGGELSVDKVDARH